MHMTHCPHCGEQLEQDVKRPDGCICDNNEWGDPFNLPPVCDKFEADHVGMNCTRCEHDYGCHTEARSNVELTGLRRPYGEGPVERHVGRQNGGTE